MRDCPLLLPKKGLPESLSRLIIDSCPLLKQRLEFEKGEDWHKVVNIHHIESSTLGSQNYLQSAVNSFLVHSVPLNKAQTRWKMLFRVLRWFSMRRLACWEKVERNQSILLN
ncbi:hypothetical protein M9H77_04803 [Catharanthus roseus]|uniref:Uncharacterized protein n=1 Tax=Catharanthus roseus TaxID=4058 RepID=A0ACC0CF89_CATRO|nr:hypothetical protein M9H77_04803 [Catharanthus roseus]